MQCPFCQAETPDKSICCPACGARLGEDVQEAHELAGSASHAPGREQYFRDMRAKAVLTRAVARLGAEMAEDGRAHQFLRLRGFLTGEEPEVAYGEIARAWGVGEQAVRVIVHRLRKRLALMLREELVRSGLP